MAADVQSSPERREREIFLAALEKRDPAERAAFIVSACGDDAILRERVTALVGEQETIADFLETPAIQANKGPGGTEVSPCISEKPGERIGRYKLLQNIGEGGCGVVYMAEQEEPVRRRVALKIIKLGMDTRSVIARFEVERQALAMMDHPNIAKVFDAGATGAGRPYFVMELVRGVKITEYCDQSNLSTRQRLELFIQVCHAIQHAHHKGIIHRDIKPSNILVTLHDSKPVPKVIDFGIAKAVEQRLTDKTLFTEFAAFIGTPTYMSPEQAEMSGLDMDTRSDVYSLGVLLYELLTGKTPFDAETLMASTIEQCRRTIREEEPFRPSMRLATMAHADLTTTASRRRIDAPKLISSLRGDLDWIVMKCLEKDRTQRYATVNDLAVDVQNCLQGDPVTARPPSTVYRMRKLYRRNRGPFLAAAAIVGALTLGAGLSVWQAIRATRAERVALDAQGEETRLRLQAEQGQAAASLNEYIADINLAHQAVKDGNFRRAVQLLEKHRPKAGEPDRRGFEWRYLWQLCQGDPRVQFPAQDSPVESVTVSPAGNWIAVGLRDKINIYDAQTKALVKNLTNGGISVAFLPDGKFFVGASRSTVRVWNTADWTQRAAFSQSFGPGFERFRERAIAISRDGKQLAAVSGEGVTIWETANWQQLQIIEDASGPLSFSPDGNKLAAMAPRDGLAVWSLNPLSKLALRDSTNLFGWVRNAHSLTFSPDGRFVVAPQNTLSDRGVFIIKIWDTQTGETSYMPGDPDHIEHTGAISSLAFSSDGKTLMSASYDHSIRLWDFEKRERVSTLHGHLNEIWAAAFSPDGQQLVSGAKDGAVHLWPTRQERREEMLAGTWSPLGFSKDARRFAALNRDGFIGFFNSATRELEQDFAVETGRFGPRFALSADLKVIAYSVGDGRVKIWRADAREETELKLADRRIEFIALAPDASILITSGNGRGLKWWDLGHTPSERQVKLDAMRIQFSPDGSTLAALQRDGLQLWDIASATVRTNLVLEGGWGFAFTFSSDGKLFATAPGLQDTEYTIQLWETATCRMVGEFNGHKQPIASIAFGPDSRTLASSSEDSTLKFWNIATGQELLNIRRLGGPVRGLMFSPDGQVLIGRGQFSESPVGGLCFYRAPRTNF